MTKDSILALLDPERVAQITARAEALDVADLYEAAFDLVARSGPTSGDHAIALAALRVQQRLSLAPSIEDRANVQRALAGEPLLTWAQRHPEAANAAAGKGEVERPEATTIAPAPAPKPTAKTKPASV